jgi:hypothetical protein
MAKSFGEVEGAMDVRYLFHKDLHVSPACKLESVAGIAISYTVLRWPTHIQPIPTLFEYLVKVVQSLNILLALYWIIRPLNSSH